MNPKFFFVIEETEDTKDCNRAPAKTYSSPNLKNHSGKRACNKDKCKKVEDHAILEDLFSNENPDNESRNGSHIEIGV